LEVEILPSATEALADSVRCLRNLFDSALTGFVTVTVTELSIVSPHRRDKYCLPFFV